MRRLRYNSGPRPDGTPPRFPDMIVLEGQPALSHFRRARLESKLQSIAPAVRVRGAWHVYFIEADPGASPDLATLRRIEPHFVALNSTAARDEIERTAARDGNHATWLRKCYAESGSVQSVVRASVDALRRGPG